MKIQTVSTAARRQRQTFNSGQFTPTVLVTKKTEEAIKDGQLNLKRGQWVISGEDGTRGQLVRSYVQDRLVKPSGLLRRAKVERQLQIEVRPYVPGRSFADYQRSV